MGLPWQSVVWLACIQCRVCGFNLWSGNWDPTCYAVWPKQTNRNSWMSGYRQTEVRYRGFSHKERVVDACALHCFVYIFILFFFNGKQYKLVEIKCYRTYFGGRNFFSTLLGPPDWFRNYIWIHTRLINRETQNLITCIHQRGPEKLSNSPECLKLSL